MSIVPIITLPNFLVGLARSQQNIIKSLFVYFWDCIWLNYEFLLKNTENKDTQKWL